MFGHRLIKLLRSRLQNYGAVNSLLVGDFRHPICTLNSVTSLENNQKACSYFVHNCVARIRSGQSIPFWINECDRIK